MTTLSTLAGNVSTVGNTQTLTNKDLTAASNTFPATGTQGFVASGAISTGDTVVLNSDGTVSVVAGVTEGAGTAVVFESATSNYMSATYDANAQKVVIAYQDDGNSYYGTAIVGTVSGTSISFGTAVVFESASSNSISAVYDANAQKVVIAYRDVGNSQYGTAVVGTVSGTSISFGTAVVFESANSFYISATYDSNAQKVVIAYRDDGNSSYGTSVVFQNEGTNAPSYIGLSTQTVTDTDPVDVTIIGGVNEDITGLTAASLYYVADNGDLTTIVTDTYAGRALASTKLLVRG